MPRSKVPPRADAATPPPVGNLLEARDGTPVVRLQRLAPTEGAALFVKLESLQPTGSIKDRLALPRLEQALAAGALNPGAPVVTAGMGNLAIALAQACALRGHPLHAFLPDTTSLERRAQLRHLGVTLTLTAGDAGRAGAIRAAEAEVVAHPGRFLLLADLARDAALYADGLGAELVAQIQADGGRVDAFVAGAGSGATLLGVGKALREAFGDVRLIGVRPAHGREGGAATIPVSGTAALGEPSDCEAVLVAHEASGGVGGGQPPGGPTLQELQETADLEALRTHVDGWEEVGAREAWQTRGRLAREEGLLLGIGAGATLAAALRVSGSLGPAARVYTLAAETGERDFSLERAFP